APTVFFRTPLPPPRSPLFPYTTLFRSADRRGTADAAVEVGPLIARPVRPPGVAAAVAAACRLLPLGVGRQTAAGPARIGVGLVRSEEHTSELQSLTNIVCPLLL